MKNKNYLYQLIFFIIPVTLAVISIPAGSMTLSASAIASSTIIVLSLPACKYRENLWAFIATSIISVPLNFRIMVLILNTFDNKPFESISTAIVTLIGISTLMSIENIVIGIIVRIIKPQQVEFDE